MAPKVPALAPVRFVSVAFRHHFALTSALHRLSPKLDDAMCAGSFPQGLRAIQRRVLMTSDEAGSGHFCSEFS
jgi:hypothetical protein